MKKTQKISNEALERLIAYASENHGTVSKVTARVSELSRIKIAPQQVGVWLHQDPAQRVEPKLGTGLLLMRIAEEIVPAGWRPR